MRRLLPAAALLATASLAHASGAEVGHGGVPWGMIAKQAANFFILAAALVYFLKKPLSDFLKERSATLSKAIDDAAKAKADGLARMAAIDAKMANLPADIEAMNKKMASEGEEEARKIREAAAAEIERIRQQAKFAADQEVKQAKAELRAEAALLAGTSAEEIVRKSLTSEDQERLVRENIDRIREMVK